MSTIFKLTHKIVIAIVFILCSNFCFSQIRDTTLSDTSHLSIDKSFEISVSMLSPGVAVYISEIKNYMNSNDYFNMFSFGFCFRNIATNFLINLKGITLIDSFKFKNQLWTKGMKLTYYSVGANLSYSFHLTSRLSVKPFAGISTSKYYLVKNKEDDPEQNSNTSYCGQFGINAEYRFKPKRLNSFVDEIGNIKWNNQYWALQLQTGVFPSIFKGNTGFKGDLIYIAIGGSINIGEYAHHRK